MCRLRFFCRQEGSKSINSCFVGIGFGTSCSDRAGSGTGYKSGCPGEAGLTAGFAMHCPGLPNIAGRGPLRPDCWRVVDGAKYRH